MVRVVRVVIRSAGVEGGEVARRAVGWDGGGDDEDGVGGKVIVLLVLLGLR